MELNLILSGVGGQGILTNAKVLSIAALKKSLNLKQAEVHGMSQRGGAVQSHLRLADHEISSDLIPFGDAHMVLSVEPLEVLRYLQYLREDGVVVSSTNAFVNIPNYPAIEQVLERIAHFPRHILLDANRISKLAGSGRAANIVLLGAASHYLPVEPAQLETAVGELFASKGPKIVEMNTKAFKMGRNAAVAYREALERGLAPANVRNWLDTLTAEQLADDDGIDLADLDTLANNEQLSGAEADAFETILTNAYASGRKQLFEHEVYQLIELVGAIAPPRYVFVEKDATIRDTLVDHFPGDKVVLKLVSKDIVHKTEAGAVVFVPRDQEVIQREIARLYRTHQDKDIAGVLIVEFVEQRTTGFGSELFVGVRATREFGPVIAAGLGGVDTEYLARKMQPGAAVAKALASDTTAEEFLELFRATAAYEVLAGQTRGHERVVSDGELLRCFRAFILIARRFCTDRGDTGPDLGELEVNPFTFRQNALVPLDGRARLATAIATPAPRPIEKINNLIAPKTIAVAGVSAKNPNSFGRVILRNVKSCGFKLDNLLAIKPGETEIDGVKCVDSVAAAGRDIDMLVLAVPADQLPAEIDKLTEAGNVKSVILVPGGVGETEGSDELAEATRAAILRARQSANGGPVFVGPNSMGVQSRIGGYDTFFIPKAKLDNRMEAPARRVALLSQSGAFIITRLSNLLSLDPAVALSIGNQIDLTLADYVRALAQRDELDVLGIYAEGFNDTDGLEFVRAVGEAVDAGKVVVFYKAGRTESGRSAAAGHTAAVAGDYDVCRAALTMAGALVADSFQEFEQLVSLATALHAKPVRGLRIGALSNAGFETVGMADNTTGPSFALTLPTLADTTRESLQTTLAQHKLDKLVNARNPLDVTPMASDAAYEDCTRVFLQANEIDAAIVSCVPLSPALLTTAEEIADNNSLAQRLPRVFAEIDKPLVANIDCGSQYDPLANALQAAGVPVFRSADQAMRVLGRYLNLRSPAAPLASAEADANSVAATTATPEPATQRA